MTTKDEALKLALEALEMSHELADTGYTDFKKYGITSDKDITAKLSTAITALREALNAPLAEQPARCEPAEDGVCEALDCPNHTAQRPARSADTWVHATPWRGLTDEERDLLRSGYQSGRIGSFVELCRAIEAKLKAKNFA